MIVIDRYVEQLKSPDRLERYDACEQLGVAFSLPEKAVLALQETTYDPSTLVADAARRALAAQTTPAPAKRNQFLRRGMAGAIYGFLLGLVVSIVIVIGIIISDPGGTGGNAVYIPFILGLVWLVGIIGGFLFGFLSEM